MNNLLPQINTRGIYTLSGPFAGSLLPDVAYTCVAVRKLEDIVALGDDPFAKYYQPFGLTVEQYKADLALGACLVSLQAGAGNWMYVPSTYITKMPDQGGIKYTTLALAVSLSALPDYVDLTYIKQQISDIVMENLGITSVVKTVALSAPALLSQTEHSALEAARQVKITNSTTDRAKLLTANTQLAAANQRIAMLEKYIRDNHPATP
jgi:hypothetical protein